MTELTAKRTIKELEREIKELRMEKRILELEKEVELLKKNKPSSSITWGNGTGITTLC